MAFSSSAHSSPLPQCVPTPGIVTTHVTSTLPLWTTLSYFMRVMGETVWTVYSRVQPLGVTTSLRRSV
jgi:hypothetical protein